MGVRPVIFESNGRRTEHVVPGVFSRSGSASSANGVNAGNLVILGKSAGGKPFELLKFSSPAEAQNVLVGDELLEAVGYAFQGSSVYVPQKVYAMRVNAGTQSKLTLNSSEQPMLEIKSKDYGYHTNQLKLWLEGGTAENSTKVTIGFRENVTEYDNIVRPSLSLHYEGEATTVTVGVSKDQISFISDSEDPTETVNFKFEDFDTLEALANRINDTNVYTATVLDSRIKAPSNELDTVAPVSLKEGDQKLYSNLYALVETMIKNPFIGSIEIKSESSRVVPDVMAGYEYFTGGTVGEYSNIEWERALKELETKDIQSIATPSSDEAIQAMIATHCNLMSTTVNKKERTCFLGGAIGEEDSTAMTRAKGFNNKLVSYVTDNAIANNPFTGEAETLSGAMVAVMLAGMESAMAVNEPLTNKSLNVLGFTKTRTQTNLQDLIQGGVCVCNPSPDAPNNLVVIRNVTTYQLDDLIYNERSMVREDMYMNREFRSKLVPSIGTPLSPSTTDVVRTLLDLAETWRTSGYIIPNEKGEAVWNIKVRIDGDAKYLDFDRYLTPPTNFIFFNVNNHVYRQAIQL